MWSDAMIEMNDLFKITSNRMWRRSAFVRHICACVSVESNVLFEPDLRGRWEGSVGRWDLFSLIRAAGSGADNQGSNSPHLLQRNSFKIQKGEKKRSQACLELMTIRLTW